MFHSELFSSSNGTSSATAFLQTNYVTADAILPGLVNGMQVSKDLPYVMAVAGVSANLCMVRIQAPSMLPWPYPTLGPNNRGTALESPPRIHDFSSNPIRLNPTEELDVYTTQNSGGAQTPFVLVTFSDGMKTPVPAGRFFTVHWTAAVTLTASAWSQVAPSLDQALPAGQYALIGARVFSATAKYFRMFPAQAPLWRPGGVAVQAYDQLDPPSQRGYSYLNVPNSTWGTWLTFYQNVVPQVEIFATSADTAEEGFYDLVQISGATI
jgi:hypothetical protein